MSRIAWFEALADPTIARRLDAFDHHRVVVADRIAVLITYLDGVDAGRVLAVVQPAADLHPRPPAWAQELVDRLSWRPCAAPG